MSRQSAKAVALAAMLVLAGCGARVLPLTYTGPPNPVRRSGSVQVGASVDQRRDHDPTWYGAIRGGFGTPLKVLRSDVPVSQVAAKAFSDALAARGMLAPGKGRFEIQLTVTRFEASRYVRLEAHAGHPRPGGGNGVGPCRLRGGRPGQQGKRQSSRADDGIFASPNELSDLMATALSEAADKIVEDPGFRRAVGDPGAPVE